MRHQACSLGTDRKEHSGRGYKEEVEKSDTATLWVTHCDLSVMWNTGLKNREARGDRPMYPKPSNSALSRAESH